MSEGKKEILLGDCLELMKDIPNGSIDMILCDLPYGTTACKWDTIIPFDKLWEQYERIIKPNGAIVLTASQPFTSALVMSNPKMFKYEWIWEKSYPTGLFNAKFQPMKYHENICIFSKNKTKYNPQMWKGKLDHNKNGCHGSSEHYNKVTYFTPSKQTNDKYPRTIQKFNCPNRAGLLHPTQKPVALFEYLIKTYTNEGDTVLDNCAGSFTTAIAAENTKRNWICIEQLEG